MSFKPIDSNRDEFRKYLERSGVIEALSKVLITLFHEQDRPDNAVDYLRINIGDALKDRDTIDSLKLELAEARREIDELKKQIITSNTVTVQTNTDGGGDAPVLQSAANNATIENIESQGKIDVTTAAMLPAQSENTENLAVTEEKIGTDSATEKEEVVKTDNEETTTTDSNTSNISGESNEQQQQTPPLVAAAATITTNVEEKSMDPPKNVE